MREVAEHLTHFAKDQLRTLGAAGPAYVRRCAELWRTEYGEAVAQAVLNNVKQEMEAAQ